MNDLEPGFDFGGAKFNVHAKEDQEILAFVLSQALYGEATGVYCGKSLYAARSLQAAKFYVRQAKQELNHLQLFADIFRLLELQPQPGHWVVRLLASHNNYYPLKVLMEHALGEGMVLDIFKDVLLQTLPEDEPHLVSIHKKLRVICNEEKEHVAWGEQQTVAMLKKCPWLKLPYYGLLELQMLAIGKLAGAMGTRNKNHPVLSQLPAFVQHVRERVWKQGQALGFVPDKRPGFFKRVFAMKIGILLYLRSQFARSRSKLDKTYIEELGF